MSTVTIEDVQLKLPELLKRLSQGESISITNQGISVGRLLPPEAPKGVPMYGRGKGKVIQMIDDDEYLKDFEGAGNSTSHSAVRTAACLAGSPSFSR